MWSAQLSDALHPHPTTHDPRPTITRCTPRRPGANFRVCSHATAHQGANEASSEADEADTDGRRCYVSQHTPPRPRMTARKSHAVRHDHRQEHGLRRTSALRTAAPLPPLRLAVYRPSRVGHHPDGARDAGSLSHACARGRRRPCVSVVRPVRYITPFPGIDHRTLPDSGARLVTRFRCKMSVPSPKSPVADPTIILDPLLRAIGETPRISASCSTFFLSAAHTRVCCRSWRR